MITIVFSGMGRDQMERLAKQCGGTAIQTLVKSDFEAATAVKQGRADYYVGACQSGAGGALAIATAILGRDHVIRLSGTGTAPDPERIKRHVQEGKRAFGLSSNHAEIVIPVLVSAILDQRQA